jgi:hypothetical protein
MSQAPRRPRRWGCGPATTNGTMRDEFRRNSFVYVCCMQCRGGQEERSQEKKEGQARLGSGPLDSKISFSLGIAVLFYCQKRQGTQRPGPVTSQALGVAQGPGGDGSPNWPPQFHLVLGSVLAGEPNRQPWPALKKNGRAALCPINAL